MTKRKKKIIIISIIIIIGIVGNILVISSDYSTSSAKKELFAKNFLVDGTYDKETGVITINFEDKSEKTDKVIIEVLGMAESYQKTFETSSFTDTIYYGEQPEFGWQVHPIVLIIEHQEFGTIDLKTEIHEQGEAPPAIIYNQRYP
jgi:tRNA(Phe) wybutosine-synthesizing methylase Tyw3